MDKRKHHRDIINNRTILKKLTKGQRQIWHAPTFKHLYVYLVCTTPSQQHSSLSSYPHSLAKRYWVFFFLQKKTIKMKKKKKKKRSQPIYILSNHPMVWETRMKHYFNLILGDTFWCKNKTDYHPKNTKPMVKQGSGSTITCDCFSLAKNEVLLRIKIQPTFTHQYDN